MITKPASFRVYGEPAPKGSMVCRRDPNHSLREQVARGRGWRKAIEEAAPIWLPEQAGKQQPIKATFLFAVTRSTAAAKRVAPAVQSAEGIGGDLDKMIRLALDALETAKVLTNDAQVTRFGESAKVFPDDLEWLKAGRPGWDLLTEYERSQAERPGMYCRLEPIGYVPPELPYEQLPDEERIG